MAVVTEDVTGRILLSNIRWTTYESMLVDLGDRPVRLTYDRGALEIMSPSKKHEWLGRVIGRFIEIMTLELGIPIQSVKSTTWRDELKERGLEADESYYVQNEPRVRGKADFDPATDPYPDLAVEVEISRSALDRMALYAALGIREVWRCDGETVTAHVLAEDGAFRPSEMSAAFGFLRVRDLEPFLRRARSTDETTLVREFLAWVRERRPPA